MHTATSRSPRRVEKVISILLQHVNMSVDDYKASLLALRGKAVSSVLIKMTDGTEYTITPYRPIPTEEVIAFGGSTEWFKTAVATLQRRLLRR